jgi:hypothetical protein
VFKILVRVRDLLQFRTDAEIFDYDSIWHKMLTRST